MERNRGSDEKLNLWQHILSPSAQLQWKQNDVGRYQSKATGFQGILATRLQPDWYRQNFFKKVYLFRHTYLGLKMNKKALYCPQASALCCFSLRKVVIGQFTKMCTSPVVFFQLHYSGRQIFEENIWSLSLSVYIWPLESWTIIAKIRFNSILRMIWGQVEC